MCFSQNGRSPIGRHVATSEAASSFTLSDTNPLSRHRSRPQKTTNAVPLNRAHTNAPSPEPLASLCTTQSHALPNPTKHAASGALAEPAKQGCKTLGSQRRDLATPLAFVGSTRGIRSPSAPPVPLAWRCARLNHDRADLTLTNILSQIQNILSILTHAKSTIEPRTNKKTQPTVGKLPPNHHPQRTESVLVLQGVISRPQRPVSDLADRLSGCVSCLAGPTDPGPKRTKGAWCLRHRVARGAH